MRQRLPAPEPARRSEFNGADKQVAALYESEHPLDVWIRAIYEGIGGTRPEPVPPRTYGPDVTGMQVELDEDVWRQIHERRRLLRELSPRIARRGALLGLAGRSIRYLRLEDRLGRSPTRADFERLGRMTIVVNRAAKASRCTPDAMWKRFVRAIETAKVVQARPDSLTVRLALAGAAFRSPNSPVSLKFTKERSASVADLQRWINSPK